MTARLTKGMGRCQAALFLAGGLAGICTAAPPPGYATDRLRECVAKAPSAQAVAACEQREQRALKARIAQLAEVIRTRLDSRQRQLFDRSQQAWDAFADSEFAMLDLTLGLRRDGLGPSLKPGAVTQIYESRERQLREHLHNLNLSTVPGTPEKSPGNL